MAAVPVAKVPTDRMATNKILAMAKALLMDNPVRTDKVPTAKMALPHLARRPVTVKTADLTALHRTVGMVRVCPADPTALTAPMALARRRITQVTVCRVARRMDRMDRRLQVVSRVDCRHRVVRVR